MAKKKQDDGIPDGPNAGDKNIGEILGLALMLPIGTFVGWGMGVGLDHLFHTHFLWIVFGVLGTIAGIMQVIRDLG